MTAWQTQFTLDELVAWRDSITDPDLRDRIDTMIKCLGMCVTNQILVTVGR